MSAHGDLQRKTAPGENGTSAAATTTARHSPLGTAAPVQALAATARALNARAALVAQRRLAAGLSRTPRVAPVQRIDNDAPEPADAGGWADFGSAAARQALAAPPAAAPNPPAAAANPGAAPVGAAGPVVVADAPADAADAAAPPAAVDAAAVVPVAANADAAPVGPAGPVVIADAPAAADAPRAAVDAPAVVPAVVAPPAAGAAPAAAAGNGLKVETGAHRAHDGPMYTIGLVNCIALVAYNAQTPLAVLYHWNTADGGLTMVADYDRLDDNGDPKTRYVPDQAGIDNAKAVVDAAVPGATAYHAVLGTGWDAELAQVRRPFVGILRQRFNGITIAAARHGSARWVAPNLIGY